MSDEKTNSTESYLGNPLEDTLLEAEELDEQIVKTKPNSKSRGPAVKYEFYCEFDKIEDIQKQITKGKIHGGPFIFKFQKDSKFRYYCNQQKNGCRAGPYLELTEGSKGNCFISIEEHSNHKESNKKNQKLMKMIQSRKKFGN